MTIMVFLVLTLWSFQSLQPSNMLILGADPPAGPMLTGADSQVPDWEYLWVPEAQNKTSQQQKNLFGISREDLAICFLWAYNLGYQTSTESHFLLLRPERHPKPA